MFKSENLVIVKLRMCCIAILVLAALAPFSKSILAHGFAATPCSHCVAGSCGDSAMAECAICAIGCTIIAPADHISNLDAKILADFVFYALLQEVSGRNLRPPVPPPRITAYINV